MNYEWFSELLDTTQNGKIAINNEQLNRQRLPRIFAITRISLNDVEEKPLNY